MNSNEMDGRRPRKIAKLDTNIPIIPPNEAVLPEPMIEGLLDASISLYKKEIDEQHFFPESLTAYFTKILNDGDVIDNHYSIKAKCEKLVELCALKLDEDSFTLMDLLAMVFDPNCKFHTINAALKSEFVSPASGIHPDEELYARSPPNPENPRGWLVDLINKFGNLGGFAILFTRFQRGRRVLTIPMIHALLRPFGLCHELLTVDTIVKYLVPIVKRITAVLNNLTDDELKEEANSDSISDSLLATIKTLMDLTSRVPQQEVIKNLESLRLRMILRLLQIPKNIPGLLVKMVRDLSSTDLDCFFQSFETTWITGDGTAREKLLKLICLLTKDDQNGTIFRKALTLFWNLAHCNEISTGNMYLALDAHVKILDSLGLHQEREGHMHFWLDKCVEECNRDDEWTLPAMRQIREICKLHQGPKNIKLAYNQEHLIELLEDEHKIFNLVRSNLVKYMKKVRQLVKENPKVDGTNIIPDGRYTHVIQVEERLDLLLFLYSDGHYLIDIEPAKEIWQCLVKHAVFPSDRESCFEWFSKSLDEEWDLQIIKDFFERHMLQLDPKLLTERGFTCFEKFFREVNIENEKLEERDEIYTVINLDLVGKDYLWRIVTTSPPEIAKRGIELLTDVYRYAGPELQLSLPEFHKYFIGECLNRLQAHYQTLSGLTGKCTVDGPEDSQLMKKIAMEKQKIFRVASLMQEYIKESNKELIES